METKNCQNCKQDFIIEKDDFSFYQKMKVPPPTFCYLCRAQRRFAFRNERVLYRTKSDFTGEEIFTMFSPDSGIKIYEREIWLSDKWDPIDYGVDYDFSKPFFTQLFELVKKVPFKNMNIVNGVNSPYTFNVTDPKNCYLVFNASYIEDCMYGHGIGNSKWCLDVSHTSKCENCYQGFWITSCSNSSFCSMCENSFNLFLCKNCHGCNDCFGCVNLRKKSYCIWNVEYTKEEYLQKIKELNLDSFSNLEKLKQRAYEFWLRFPNKYIEGLQNTDVSGNYINHSKEVKKSMLIREGQNLHYCQYLQENIGSKDCWDYSVYGDNTQLVYECHSCGINTQNIKFCLHCEENVHDLEYCVFSTTGSKDLFGCVGLRKKQYCILNKQYGKKEYFEMVERIKKHMNEMPYVDKKGRVYKYGEYFPMELSPFAYNTTLAQEYFPLEKKEVLDNGNLWEDASDRDYKIDLRTEDLPDSINDVDDNIVGKVIACEHKGNCNQLCTSAFKIMPDELSFYKKMNLPLPRLCPNCRTFERLKQRTGIKLYNRKCMKEGCNNEFETSYSPDRPEIIYCEKCYQQEVY